MQITEVFHVHQRDKTIEVSIKHGYFMDEKPRNPKAKGTVMAVKNGRAADVFYRPICTCNHSH